METQQRSGFYGWINAWILFTTYFIGLGLVFYGFTVIFPSMVNDMGWGRGEAALAHTIRGIIVGFLSPVVALMINKIGSRKTISLGILILMVGLVLLGTVTTKLWHWIVLWGFIMSIGFAFAGLLAHQAAVTNWFSIRRATVLGFVMSGAAVGGFVATPVYTWLMKYTESWQSGWLACGAFCALALIICYWIKDKPEDVGQYPDGLTPDEAKEAALGQGKSARTYRTPVEWILRDAIRTHFLWFSLIVNLGQIMGLYMMVVHGVLHITDLGYSKMQAASVLGFVILGGGIARFPMGLLGDYIEPRKIITVTCLVMPLSFVGIWKAPSMHVLMVAGPVFGFCYGTILVLVTALVGNYFGREAFPTVMGFVMPFLVAIGALVPVGAGIIADKFGSYDLAFMIIIAVMMLGFILSFFMKPPTPKTHVYE
ncbi:MAG: MFS transporter [Thermodesulfobacteriota bacterium]|nr:MFS transporter [Thermodesulfobacteriota bacterium]